MDRPYEKNEFAGGAETTFGETAHNAGTKPDDPLRHVDWFTLANQCMILSRLLTDRRG